MSTSTPSDATPRSRWRGDLVKNCRHPAHWLISTQTGTHASKTRRRARRYAPSQPLPRRRAGPRAQDPEHAGRAQRRAYRISLAHRWNARRPCVRRRRPVEVAPRRAATDPSPAACGARHRRRPAGRPRQRGAAPPPRLVATRPTRAARTRRPAARAAAPRARARPPPRAPGPRAAG